MVDELERLEMAAAQRLRDVLSDDGESGDRHRRRRDSWRLAAALAVSAVVVVAVGAVGFAIVDRDDRPSLVADDTSRDAERPPAHRPGPGARDVIDAYDTAQADWNADNSPLPPLAVPVHLPSAWRFEGLETSNSEGSGSVRLNFVQMSGAGGPLPAVLLCVTSDGGCPDPTEPSSTAVAVIVPGLGAQARLYGEPSVLRDWADARWTSDPESVDW